MASRLIHLSKGAYVHKKKVPSHGKVPSVRLQILMAVGLPLDRLFQIF